MSMRKQLHFEMGITVEQDEKRNQLRNEAISNLFELVWEADHSESGFEIDGGVLSVDLVFDKLPDELRNTLPILPYEFVEKMSIKPLEPAVLVREDSEITVPVENESESSNQENSHEDRMSAEENEDSEEITTDEAEASEEIVPDDEKSEKSVADESETQVFEEDTYEQPKNDVEKRNVRGRKSKEVDLAGKKVFEMIAKKSNSFEEFIYAFKDFLGITDYYKSFYEAIIKATCDLSLVTWKEIENEVGNEFSVSKRGVCTSAVTNAFSSEGSKITILTFLEEVAKYKDYKFGCDSEEYTAQVEEYQYKVLSKELLDVASREKSFSGKVESIFDMLNADKNDDSVYKKYRSSIIKVILEVVEAFERVDVKEQIKIASKAYAPVEVSHIVAAEIYDQIKKYCKSIHCEQEWDQDLQFFFSDLYHMFTLSK